MSLKRRWAQECKALKISQDKDLGLGDLGQGVGGWYLIRRETQSYLSFEKNYLVALQTINLSLRNSWSEKMLGGCSMGQGRDSGYLERNMAMRMKTSTRVGEVLRGN